MLMMRPRRRAVIAGATARHGRAEFSPSAVAGASFVSPLLELEDMEVVRKRLLDRAFAAVG
jgi:hypothetical protein